MKDKRKLGIALVCMLGFFLLLYLGGLFGQLLAGYEKWMREDGISGGMTMPKIQISPFFCVQNAFTDDGIKGTIGIVAAAAGITLYIVLNNRFGQGQHDERNFTYSKQGTYGTAGWMSRKEMQEVLTLSTPEQTTGTILGCIGSSVVSLPLKSKLNKHVAIFGSSGSGKSRAIVRNMLLQSVKRGESFLASDPKSELYSDLSEYCRDAGYDVKVFNLVDMTHSDSWNAMAGLNGDTVMAQMLTDVIITNTSGGRGDHFWDAGEGNLLKALILYVDQNELIDTDSKNLTEVYRMLTRTDERSLNALFDRLPIGHPAKAPFNLYRQASDTVRSGIMLGLGTRLQVLQNDVVGKVIGHSDIDLTAPGRQRCAYFVILSDQDSTFDFLSSLFFSSLFIKLIRFADTQPDGRCPTCVNLILDEFNNLGTLGGGGNDGRELGRRVSTIRSRNVNFCFAVQSLAQLQNRYPNNVWAEILGNCDVQLMLGCTDEITAEMVSARTGDVTVTVNSTMTVRKTIAVAQMIPQYRQNEGIGKRRLLTPDEVLRLPSDELIIMMRGQKVLKAKKFDFSRHPEHAKLRQCSIADYVPRFHSAPMPPPPERTGVVKPSLLELHGYDTPPSNF